MHNLFLGLIKEHFHGVLGYKPSAQLWSQTNPGEVLLCVDIPESPSNPLPTTPQEQSSVHKLIVWLETPLDFAQTDRATVKQTVKQWSNVYIASLIYVAKGVGCISLTVDAKGKDAALQLLSKPLAKVHIAEKLLDWRLKRSQAFTGTTGNNHEGNIPPPL
ncbi:hypothetical protein C0989_001265 [Termitomyces sp. Mn162]|nr:hypothetical protein C0989_001265 [Termitomyces sp. Mn162]